MIYIDIIIIVIIIYAFVKGFSKGLINEIASFLGLLIGGILAYSFSDNLSTIIDDFLQIDTQLLNILSFILIKSVEKYSFRLFAAFKSFFVPVFNTLISDFIMSSCWMIVSLNISSIKIA